MAKAGWKFNTGAMPLECVIGVDTNCGRIFVDINRTQAFVMSDKESLALAKKVIASNSASKSLPEQT